MKFLLDESADARLLPHLQRRGYDATRIARDYPAGLPDSRVLEIAAQEQRILVTADNDFGELVVRQGQPHCGVVLFRLGDYAEISVWIGRMDDVLDYHAAELGNLLVVTRTRVRVHRTGIRPTTA